MGIGSDPEVFFCLGRSAKEANLYTEICEGIHAYGITRHRHGKLLSAYTFCNLL